MYSICALLQMKRKYAVRDDDDKLARAHLVRTAKLWAIEKQQLLKANEAVLDADKQCRDAMAVLVNAQDSRYDLRKSCFLAETRVYDRHQAYEAARTAVLMAGVAEHRDRGLQAPAARALRAIVPNRQRELDEEKLEVQSDIEQLQRIAKPIPLPEAPLVPGPGPRCPFDLKLLISAEWELGMCSEHVQGDYICCEEHIRHFRANGGESC
jgi:hypothetical protein